VVVATGCIGVESEDPATEGVKISTCSINGAGVLVSGAKVATSTTGVD